MDKKAKLDILGRELENSISYFHYKHHKTKRRAYALKITAVSFGALVTVLLGLNTSSMENLFKNIAIVLGAAVTVINAIESFYDYSGLWVKNSVTLVRLQELKRKVDFYASGENESDLDTNRLDKYMDQLQLILKDDLKEWLRIREKIASQEEKKEEMVHAVMTTNNTNIKRYKPHKNNSKISGDEPGGGTP